MTSFRRTGGIDRASAKFSATAGHMRRHYIWFATGIPKTLFIHDAGYTVAECDANTREAMAKLAAKDLPDAARQFLQAEPLVQILSFNDIADKREAWEQEINRIRGLLDIYAFLTLSMPTLLPVVVRHEAPARTASVEFFDFETTAEARVGAESVQRWHAMSETLVHDLLEAFEVAERVPAHSEVAERMKLAARMFRHGRRAHDVQVEYLCKFTAVETLTCGAVWHGRGELMKRRLPTLFRGSVTENLVEKLWKIRCGASHAGGGSWSVFVQHTPDVTLLATGCLLFATAHVKTVHTIPDLWNLAPTFTLPPALFTGAFQAHAIHNVFMPLGEIHLEHVDWEANFKVPERAKGPSA
jgi:hypothetical protein